MNILQENKLLIILGSLLATALLIVAYASGILVNKASASAPSGLPSTLATSTQFAVTTTQQLLFATSSCSSRIITTRTQAVMLTFSDLSGIVPTAILGHQQAASTTVAYDSGLFGCGAVRVVSQTVNGDTLFVAETR